MSNSIDETRSPKLRVKAYWALLMQCVDDMDSRKGTASRENIARFLLHLAWHEGLNLTARKQLDDGPARSFLQFEAFRAKESLDYAREKPVFAKLAAVAGISESDLRAAADALPKYGARRASFYPANSKVEELLVGNDLFGIYLARVAFLMVPAAIPTGSLAHAKYWYAHWKKTGGDKDSLIATFATKADAVDQYLA